MGRIEDCISFLSGKAAQSVARLSREPYEDATNNLHLSLAIQPVIVLAADAPTLVQIRRRALEREAPTAIYIKEMFATGHDAESRLCSHNMDPTSRT